MVFKAYCGAPHKPPSEESIPDRVFMDLKFIPAKRGRGISSGSGGKKRLLLF
jgi:hypothetical protein